MHLLLALAITQAAQAGCALELVGYGWPAQSVTISVTRRDGLCVWLARPAKG